MSVQNSKTEVEKLVNRFKADYDRFRDESYNETEVRVEFINPLFKALGWDVENSLFVVHEDRVLVDEGGEKRVKHPDYGFKTGHDIRFYVEAKKPSVDLQNNPDPAYQVRRYGWSAKLPLSILTDFEEFIVYNCLQQPAPDDGPQVARLRYITYEAYLDQWDDIYSLFSYEAVLDGALERFVEKEKPRGTITVDDAFLQEMERWRSLLAKDIAERNPDLTRRQLNIAVQRTIDRLVFLRIAEDRRIESYGQLMSHADQGRANVYDELKDLYSAANDKYNSGLFHFTDDIDDNVGDPVSLKIHVGDDPLRAIITSLYYPNSPYEFSVLPSDILGQVYERFLGSVITLDKGSAVVEEKPEVRKAGGVYYTPTYIVDYIVQNTVGKLVEGKNPNQVAELRILDPACGSGSFLIGAYQFLMDWHLAYYTERITENPNSTFKSRVLVSTDPTRPYILTTDEKKRILLNNIYGVDLDQQAVEVTKLSLLLKMLENEMADTATQYKMFSTDERLLPDLASNIKWGNSLIGSDFYEGKQLPMFEDEEIYRVKAFDWESDEGFGSIMGQGGFDAVIGNPPYIRIQTMKEFAPETVSYYKQRYIAAKKGNYDIYVIFVEKGVSLLSSEGRLGYILPHKFFNAKYGEPLRGLISKGKHLAHVVHFGHQQVFEGATTYTCLMFLDKSEKQYFEYIEVSDLENWRATGMGVSGKLPRAKVTNQDWNFIVGQGADLFRRLSGFPIKLKSVDTRMSQGVRTSANQIYVLEEKATESTYIRAISNSLGEEVLLERDAVLYFLQGREIKPYEVIPSGKTIIMPYTIDGSQAILIPPYEMQARFPQTWEYLKQNKDELEGREKGRFRGDEWYVYGRNQNIDLMLLPKILVPDIANRASFALDENGDYAFTSGYGITLKKSIRENVKYILGLLNSKVLDFYLKQVSTTIRGGYFRYFTQYIEQLPIRTIDFDNPADKARHDNMVELVQTMLDLHKQLPEASGQAKKVIQQRITATDRQIDTLVYELYGLTDEEIAIVENSS